MIDDRDVRGGHDCLDHVWVDGRCGICHERSPMREMVLVFDTEGWAIFWKGPKGSSEGYVEDSDLLWDRIWHERAHIGGVAHTHPWNGEAHPSQTDVTTWAAIEAGLGKRLLWPIVTMTEVKYFVFNPVTKNYVEATSTFADRQWWKDNIDELRLTSRGG